MLFLGVFLTCVVSFNEAFLYVNGNSISIN